VKIELLASLNKVIKKYPELQIIAINTDNDHIHIQIEIPPDVSVAATVQQLKSMSSSHLKRKFKFIKTMYLDGGIWSVGYFSSTIGLNEEQIKKYIAWQGQRDLPQTATLGF
jgi:putative transposase